MRRRQELTDLDTQELELAIERRGRSIKKAKRRRYSSSSSRSSSRSSSQSPSPRRRSRSDSRSPSPLKNNKKKRSPSGSRSSRSASPKKRRMDSAERSRSPPGSPVCKFNTKSVVGYDSSNNAPMSPRREESRSRSPPLNISLVSNKKMPPPLARRSPSKERAVPEKRGPSKESLEAARRASHLRRGRSPPRRYPPRPPPDYRYGARDAYYYDYGAQQQYVDVYEPSVYQQNWGTDYRRPDSYQRLRPEEDAREVSKRATESRPKK